MVQNATCLLLLKGVPVKPNLRFPNFSRRVLHGSSGSLCHIKSLGIVVSWIWGYRNGDAEQAQASLTPFAGTSPPARSRGTEVWPRLTLWLFAGGEWTLTAFALVISYCFGLKLTKTKIHKNSQALQGISKQAQMGLAGKGTKVLKANCWLTEEKALGKNWLQNKNTAPETVPKWTAAAGPVGSIWGWGGHTGTLGSGVTIRKRPIISRWQDSKKVTE